jgi:antirestriction protein ArdC
MARSPHKARSRHKLTDAEREQRRRRDRERLADAIRELLSSEGWRAWLGTRATLHGYSLRNTYLIAQEARRRGFEPTHVAGFRAWLKLGRVVRKGEPGLAILAPVSVKRRDTDGEETGERRTFFRTVHVWDLSQTTPLPGVEPAPLAPPRQPLSGSTHTHLLRPLERLAAELGYTVSYRPLARVEGLCDFRARRISIETSLPGNARVATLVHELGHALIDRELAADGRLGKRVEELIVEAVAYVALATAGHDTGPDSVPYIASWEGDDALEQLQQTAQLIDALARRIEQTIAPQEQAEPALALRAAG